MLLVLPGPPSDASGHAHFHELVDFVDGDSGGTTVKPTFARFVPLVVDRGDPHTAPVAPGFMVVLAQAAPTSSRAQVVPRSTVILVVGHDIRSATCAVARRSVVAFMGGLGRSREDLMIDPAGRVNRVVEETV